MSLLSVERLSVRYGDAHVVDKLAFEVAGGETVGLVGESGSGKTQTALALMGLLPAEAAVSGSVRFADTELVGAGDAVLNSIRTRHMAMVFQDPLQALNPYLRVGEQLARILLEHALAAGGAVMPRVLDMLRQVGLPDPERQARAYPHELSGGMRQRAMIAAALIGEPDLLVADEPTTALDVTVQAQILALLRSLKERHGIALLLITHDLGVIAGNSERVLVLDAGRIVEEGATTEFFRTPRHARSRALLAATPSIRRIDVPGRPADGDTLLAAERVSVSYLEKPYAAVWRRHEVRAVRDVSLALRAGETLALVGESGSGKTSLVRGLLGMLALKSGRVSYLGSPLAARVERRPRDVRRAMQLVFQDPVGSLNPAMRVGDIVAEPLRVHERSLPAGERRAAVDAMLARVALPAELAARFPHQLSGGQAQRVALARALIVRPRLLVLDEPVAALDGETRAGILALLREEQQQSGLAMLFISHDLGVVKSISHRVQVMYMGRICEIADGRTLFSTPRHPYTRALIDSVPLPDPGIAPSPPPVEGEVSSLLRPPTGCAFHPRCPWAVDRCRRELPRLEPVNGAQVACHRSADIERSLGDQKS